MNTTLKKVQDDCAVFIAALITFKLGGRIDRLANDVFLSGNSCR